MKEILKACSNLLCNHIMGFRLIAGVLSIISTIIFTEIISPKIVSKFNENNLFDSWILFWGFILLLIILIPLLLNFFEKNCLAKFKELENKYKDIINKTKNKDKILDTLKQEIRTILQAKMHSAAEKLKFSEADEKIDRITVYRDLEDGTLFALDRYSLNGMYREIDPTKTYPINKGAIGKGYEHIFFISPGESIPDPAKKSQYIKHLMKEYQYTPEDIDKIKMHCRFFAVQRINKASKILGLIVIESLKPNRFEEQEIRLVLEDLSKEIKPLFSIWSKEAENVMKTQPEKSQEPSKDKSTNDKIEVDYDL